MCGVKVAAGMSITYWVDALYDLDHARAEQALDASPRASWSGRRTSRVAQLDFFATWTLLVAGCIGFWALLVWALIRR